MTMHCLGYNYGPQKPCIVRATSVVLATATMQSSLQELLSWPQQSYIVATARSVVLVIVTVCTVLATTTVVLTIASMNCHGHNYCCGCSHHALTKPQHVLSWVIASMHCHNCCLVHSEHVLLWPQQLLFGHRNLSVLQLLSSDSLFALSLLDLHSQCFTQGVPDLVVIGLVLSTFNTQKII